MGFGPVCGAEGELRSNDCMMIVVFNKRWKLIIELNVLGWSNVMLVLRVLRRLGSRLHVLSTPDGSSNKIRYLPIVTLT